MFSSRNRFRKISKYATALVLMLVLGQAVWAETPPAEPSVSNPFVVVMIIIMAILALVIGLLANLLLGAAQVQSEKEKEAQQPEASSGTPKAVTAGVVTIGLLLMGLPSHAQEKAAEAATSMGLDGVSPTAFYLMVSVIFLELIVVTVLLYNVRYLLNIHRRTRASIEGVLVKKTKSNWWSKLNQFKPIEQEMDIDLGHDYDGIRELDNRLPPWWLYGFYITILFAGIYLYRFHVSHSGPSGVEELQIAMNKAAVEKEAYLKKAANNIDETNAKLLTGTADLDAGKNIFQSTCAACHGKNGEGVVGPNLTDEYWLHGGSLHDIFKTIKYGWPDKGMKSWKDDYSPLQIEQIASYVKSLHGTNPPNPKAPQGVVYTDQPEAVDSAAAPKDSTKTSAQ